MVDLLEEVCSAEWGEWPKAVGVSIQDGQWLFRFRNHEEDQQSLQRSPLVTTADSN